MHARSAAAVAPLAMALEPRMLFDGAIAATVIDTQDSSPEPASADDTSSAPGIDATAVAGSADNRQEIVFVDTQVQDYQQLLAGLPADVEVVMFDGSSDGLQVIADTLAGRSAIDAIHILSHGDNGQVQLGNDWFDSADIAARGDLLATIGQSMSEDGDILLYGCTLGGDGAGVEFIDALASATGADIAASNDLTGAADKGGDWVLESSSGAIETQSLASYDYSHLLAVPADQNFDGEAVASLGSNSVTIGNVTYTNNDSFNIAIVNNGDLASGADHALAFRSTGFGTSTEVSFKSADGSEFKLNSFDISSGLGGTLVFTVKGYRDNAEVASTTFDVSGLFAGTLNVAGDSSWENIDEVRISGTDLDVDIDNLDFGAAVAAAPPTITRATYNAATGVLTATGTNMTTGDNIDVSTLTLTGEGGSTYTLTDSSNVTASSSTTFSVTLSATDKAALNLIANRNGSSSTGGTTFNLAAADDWNANVTAGDTADATNAVTVSSVATPTISRATYDADTGAMVVSGSDFLSRSGASNDIVASKFTLTGEGGATYTLTDTANVEVTSGTSFTLTLSATDLAQLNLIMNNNGTSSTGATTYNLAAAEDWAAGADVTVAVADLTSNGITVSNAADTTPPTASILVADTALAAGETSLVTISFSEAVTGLTSADFTVANGALSGLGSTDGGITWTATLTPTADVTDTSNLVTLDNSGVADTAGNAGSGSTNSNNYAIDTLRPTASIVVADSSLIAGETSGVTISFNEAVTGLTSADFTVANGALSGLGSTDGGITWTATLTPSADVTDASNLVTLDNTGVADTAGNAGTGSTDSNNYAIDTLRPTANIVVADTALAAGETSGVTITFSEAVTGLTVGDFTVANGVLSSLSSADGGISWTATLTPSTSVEDSSNLISLDNTGVADTAGNAGTGSTDSNNYAIDTLRPTASIVVADTALAAGETSGVTITFSEAVTGLTVGDFSVANGALSSLSSADGGISWTATLTPTADITDASNLVTLNNTGVADSTGNAGTGSTDSNNYAIDTLRPTASIVVADTALSAGETSGVTITFSEAVTGLTVGDFSVANGVLSGLSSADGGISWTATLTPSTSVEDSSNLVTLDNTGVADSAGNAGTGSTDSNNYAIDTLRPTASIVVADTALAAGETSGVTITFSEAVTGLTGGDFTVANGVLSGLSSADGGITWTATLTPSASVEDSSNLISLDNTGVADSAGNAGTGSTDSNNYAIDTLRPTASIVVADTALAAGETSGVTITFSEAVTGLTVGDFSVANGVLSGLSSADGGISWTATLTPSASVEDSSNLISLDNTGVADTAGNAGSGSTDSNNYAIDTLRPTASIVVADTSLIAGETSGVTITFSEAVTGLTVGDFSVANGVLSSLSSADGGISWTATLTPSTSVEDSSNLVTLDNTGVADSAGNTGTGSTDSNNYAIDTLRPTASIVVADTALAAGETSGVTITFSEAVTGLTVGDFSVANGVLSSLSSADGGISWTATLTPSTSVEDSSNLVTLDNTGVADTAGNTGSGSTDSNNYAIDTLRPTASIVVADTALAAGETSLVTITFNEAVTGLSVGDFSVANGVLSGLSSADGGISWTATLTPSADVTDTSNLVTLDNTGVADTAGNAGSGSTDSNNYAIDTLRPTASIVVADTALIAGETSGVTISFNEAVTGLTSGDFTVANGSLSGLATTDGGISWTATLTPSADIEDSSNLISLDNSGVADTAGNAGSGSTDSNNYAIDTLIPAVTSVAVPADGTYVAGQSLDFTVNLSEAVLVDTTGGTPRLAVTLDVGGTVYADYVSGSGSTALLFSLTVLGGQLDTNGIALGTNIELNGATLSDGAGNNATSALNSIGSTAAVLIDAVAPSATSISVPSDGALVDGEMYFELVFDEAVSGVDIGDFSLLATGNVIGTLDNVQQIDPSTYRIMLTGINGNGSLSLSLNAIGSGIEDNAGNPLAAGLTGPGYDVATLTGDPEFRTSTLGARPASTASPLFAPAIPEIPPSPYQSPLQPPQLFAAPTLGSGIPTLSALFINNGAPAPSYIAQVFGGNGHGQGFLEFGGSDAGVFGHSTLSNIFDPDSELEPISLPTGLGDVFGTPGSGAPTLGQQLEHMQNTEQRQIEQLAKALSEIQPGEPHA
ncbi:hypothetical protein A8C75_09855 [Marinobacterium aestuarii]|uniref:DUF4347 domain-containing protein n=2 Tax=Marinobacterium aestuarii TaxID=1821621 RepID=A0A1A9EXY4_9GAMM|nr:hypothetical protein A8C75_09855 [Marinobacterium aestuarii]